MAELLSQSTTVSAADAGTPIDVTLPDALTDDSLLVLLVVVNDHNVSLTTPTGWTLRYDAAGSGAGGNPASFAWFYRVNDGAVTAPSVPVSRACNAIAVLTEWGGYDPANPVPADVSGGNWHSAVVSPLSVRGGYNFTPTVPGTMVSFAYSSLEARNYAVASGGTAIAHVSDDPRDLLVAYKPHVTAGSEPDILVSFTDGGVHTLSSLLIARGPAGLQSLPRIRSHVSEDAGSLFQATQAVAVEAAVSEAFPYGTAVPARFMAYREALTPDQLALRYHPIPTRNQEMLVTVEGETNLGRMARVYPAPIITRVADIPGHSGETMTAQQAIQHVFDRWASEFAWFQPLPVPDLRLLVGEAVADPRQHYIDHPEAGVLTTEAIVIPQDGDNRRTMREIVDEWLAIFPGTIIRQNAAGGIELVPRVGPDAPDEALTLEWRDILSISDGEDDPRGVINRARVTSQGWEWRDDEAVVPPLYVLATRSDGLTPAAMQEVTDGLTAEPLANGGEREFEVFVEPDTPLDVDVTFSAWSASNPSGTGGLLEEVTLPLSFTVALGQTRTLEFSWFIFGVDNEKTFVYVTRTERGLKVRVVGDRYRFGPNPFAGTRYVAYLLEVTAVTGTAWTRSNEAVTAEFSLANGDFVPGPGGANALATSTALYGEREATIRSDVFQLTPEQAQAVTQGYVLFNINPRTIRDVQQSEWNRYPVKFDHIGRLVDLPNGERAVVENRSYSDSFAPDGGFMQSTFTATVQELVIDTTTEYLYLDDGDYMRLDDGTLVEAS